VSESAARRGQGGGHVPFPESVAGCVVVGDDGSAESAHAVRWAAATAGAHGYPLVVLRAWSLTSAPRPQTWRPGFVPGEDEFAESVEAALRRDVEATLGVPTLGTVTCLSVHDTPDAALVAASHTAHLVVVGSHGRHLARALLGTTADHVVRHAHCPVAVVPTPGGAGSG
jgi:nucleotide-binding universal stress UspA family protein